MRVIYKYELEKKDKQAIVMPEGAMIRHVSVQNDDIVVWAEVETEKKKVCRHFSIFATGEQMQDSDPRYYLTTVHWKALVLHVYLDLVEYPVEGS